MLKLEKIGRRDISVSLRDKQNRFDRTFLKAFAIAIALHLGALILFHIHPFIAIGDKILPPSLVESDIAFGNNDILAEIEREGIPQRHLLEPKMSILDIPAMPEPYLQRNLEYIKENSLLDNPFLEIEEDWEYLASDGKSIPIPKPIQVHVSGELAKIPLINDGSTHQDLSSFSTSTGTHQSLIVYTVQVESTTGRIFWYMPKNGKTIPMNGLVEKILSDIRFQTDPKTFIHTGEIEIQLTFHDFKKYN